MIRSKGMEILVENLGMVEAERFIMLMGKEPFDYTEWQAHLWENRSVDEIHDAAARFYLDKQERVAGRSNG